jgi:hypothetical protein
MLVALQKPKRARFRLPFDAFPPTRDRIFVPPIWLVHDSPLPLVFSSKHPHTYAGLNGPLLESTHA